MAERYVVFESSTGHHWWSRLQPHGFGHCFAIVGAGTDRDGGVVLGSLVLDTSNSEGLRPKFYFASPGAVARKAAEDGGYVLDCTAVPEARRAKIPVAGLLWCVSCCKAVLGVRARPVTPKGLADWLLAHGAKELRP